MMNKIKLGFLGGGGDSLIGILHRIAATMYDQYEIVGGVFNPQWKKNIAFAKTIGLDTACIYPDYETMVTEQKKIPVTKRMQVVSILTPNYLHYRMAKHLLENDFHVICEKPLTITYDEATTLNEIVKSKKLSFAVTYTYTGYPMVRQMRKMIENGGIGKIQKVDIQYYQGWINPIIHNSLLRKKTWRLDKNKSGMSCCMGDIGTHAFDMLEYLTQKNVTEILAHLNYVYDDNKMDVDGTVLIKMSQNIHGILRVSQIASGEENNLSVAIYGTQGGLKWCQENPNEIEYLKEEEPTQILKKGNKYNDDFSQDAVKIPPGHPEGIFDAMGNIYKGVAKSINGDPYDKAEFPSINCGVRGMDFIEKVIESHKKGNVWIPLTQ